MLSSEARVECAASRQVYRVYIGTCVMCSRPGLGPRPRELVHVVQRVRRFSRSRNLFHTSTTPCIPHADLLSSDPSTTQGVVQYYCTTPWYYMTTDYK